jgi:hypothetical protein
MADLQASDELVSEYLEEIAAPDPIRQRVLELIDTYSRLVDLVDADYFINDEIDAEGNRSFRSVWILTRSTAFEGQIALDGANQIDGTALAGRVIQWIARSESFDFTLSQPSSRLGLEVWFSDQLVGDFRATGSNCIRLAEVLRKHIIPNSR